MRTVKLAVVSMFGLIALFTATAFAAGAVTPQDESASAIAKAIFDAVTQGSWWAAAAYGVILACIGVRRFLPVSWKEGVKGDIVGTAVAFALAFAGAIANWCAAPGAVMTGAVLLTATKIGVAAIGGYTIIHKALGWLAAWGKVPAWLLSILKIVGALVGSNAIAKAEAAGAVAVATTPATGLAGSATIREVE